MTIKKYDDLQSCRHFMIF